jgi:hypothetical protein
MMRRRLSVLAGVLALAVLASLLPRQLAAQIAPAGPEVRVDAFGGDRRPDCPSIGVASDNSFEIVWGDTFSPDVEGRHYEADGTPTDPFESRLATVNDSPAVLAVTPVANGFRVLIETADDTGHRPPKFYQRRVDRDGEPAGGPPRPIGAPGTDWISTGPGGTLFAGVYNPARHRLSVQKVDDDGKPGGKPYVLNSRPIDIRAIPRIVPLADGGWVAVFVGHSIATPGSPARQVIRARRFDAAGRPAGPDFDVNLPLGAPGSSPGLDFRYLVVAADPAGGFAIAWEVGQQIRLSFFNAAGVRVGKSYTIIGSPPLFPASAGYDDLGRLLLLYGGEDGSASLYGHFFTPDAILESFFLYSAASGAFTPICGNAAWIGDSWLATWVGRSRVNGSSAIFMRRFR